jgi:acetyl-CoA synthetase
LCIKKPWPSLARTIYGDKKRYLETYFKPFPGVYHIIFSYFIVTATYKFNYIIGYYFTGDGAFYDKDKHLQITGRVDDVINVSGHRIGTAEIEDVLVAILILYD